MAIGVAHKHHEKRMLISVSKYRANIVMRSSMAVSGGAGNIEHHRRSVSLAC